MSGSSFGHMFRVHTFGESHGPAVGAIVDGCPAGLPLSEDDLMVDLARRRPGGNSLGSARNEGDQVEILSGVSEGLTTGTAIGLLVRNKDARPGAYDHMKELYRPSHADYTYQAKYGHRTKTGGGRASARETVARVAAGAIARKLLATQVGVDVVAWVDRVSSIQATVDPATVSLQNVLGAEPIFCPDLVAAPKMTNAIEQARKSGDTVGGVIGCVARNVPAGWGDPGVDKLDARLAYAMIGLPAAKGFDLGSGFAGVDLTGSEHNDAFVPSDDGIRTATNRSGGIQGGISNAMPIHFRVGFKPVATHFKAQATVKSDGSATEFQAKGRHDPCVLPRAVVMVEAMTTLVLCDAWLRHRGQMG